MKKIFFVIFAFVLFASCSDDDGSDYHYELLPTEEAIVPESFEFGQVYEIAVKYIVPDDCYISSDILYEYDLDARNIAVIALVVENDACEPLEEEATLTFNVQALQHKPYIFRFWQGEDDNGDPIYLEVVVPVISSEQSVNEAKTTDTKM